MPGSVLDQFPQTAVLHAQGLAAATGDLVAQLVTGITNLQKICWKVKRIEYTVPRGWLQDGVLATPAQWIKVGITQSAAVGVGMDFHLASLVDFIEFSSAEVLTAVGYVRHNVQPIVHSFHDEFLVLPQNIFLGLNWSTGSNLDGSDVYAKIWYREHEISAADWYDLLQLRLPLGAT
jgi:hypothetical protein